MSSILHREFAEYASLVISQEVPKPVTTADLLDAFTFIRVSRRASSEGLAAFTDIIMRDRHIRAARTPNLPRCK